MLKFNIEEHKLEELEKYNFKNVTHKMKTANGTRNDIEEYCYVKGYEYDDGINTIIFRYDRLDYDWIIDVDLYQLDIYESDYEMGVSIKAINTIYDLIKNGLIIKE